MRVARLETLEHKKDLVRCYSSSEFQVSWLPDDVFSRGGKKEPHEYLKLIATFERAYTQLPQSQNAYNATRPKI